MHKRLTRPLSCVLSAALVLSLAVLPASAATGSQEIQVDYKGITVTLDGAPLTLADAKGNIVEPFAYQGTTYLPLRAVAGALGLEVAWDAASSTVALTSGAERAVSGGMAPAGTNASAAITVDYKNIAVTLDGAPLTLTDAKGAAVEPFAYQGTTYLPLRAVAGALGLEVAWDAASATVALTSDVPAAPVGGEVSYSPEIAQRYIKGLLDEWYFGTYEEQYLLDVGSTPERVRDIYEDSVAGEAAQFVAYIGIDYPEDVNNRLIDLWKQISAKVSYTVGPATGPDTNGTYSVQVTAKPVDIYKLVDEAWTAFSDEFEAKFADVDVNAMTEAQYHDWYVNEYDKTYRDGLCDLLETLIPKMGYLPEQTITVRVELDSAGYYGLNSDDNMSLSGLLIPVNY